MAAKFLRLSLLAASVVLAALLANCAGAPAHAEAQRATQAASPGEELHQEPARKDFVGMLNAR